MARLTTRIMRSLVKSDFPQIKAVIFSDSESALKLIRAMDLPRRSRHIEIKIEWIRELVANQLAEIKYQRGSDLVADALTKCLSTMRFEQLREIMGFQEKPITEALLQSMVAQTGSSRGFAFLEVCCDVHSKLRSACQDRGIAYRGITYGVEMKAVQQRTKEWVDTLTIPLHVHLSTLCSSGSPLRRFANLEQASELDASWDEHISGAVSFMKFRSSTSFELPLSNNIWGRWFVQQTLKRFQHDHFAIVHLCQTGLSGSDKSLISKKLKFTSSIQGLTDHLHQKFGACRCLTEHSTFNHVTWRNTALYNATLANAILDGLSNTYGTK